MIKVGMVAEPKADDVQITLTIDRLTLQEIVQGKVGAQEPKVPVGTPLKGNQGKFVFLECQGESKYYSGEYLCVRETPNVIYGVKPTIGYHGHEIKAFNLKGEDAYAVLDAREDWAGAREFAEGLARWAEAREPKRWVDYIYEDAAATAKQVLALLDRAGH